MMIINMYNENVSIEVISKYTKLSISEIREIINKLLEEEKYHLSIFEDCYV